MPKAQVPEICEKVCGIVHKAVSDRSMRAGHGQLVSSIVGPYFQRVKPSPESARVVTSTRALALIHQIRENGKDGRALEHIIERVGNEIAGIPDFQQELGVSQDGFMYAMQRYHRQRAGVAELDLSPEATKDHYERKMREGGLELPPMFVEMADLSLDFAEGVKGLPKGERITTEQRRVLADNLVKFWFPLADMVGLYVTANNIRRNGILWVPERKRKYDIEVAKMDRMEGIRNEAMVVLRRLVDDALASSPLFGKYRHEIHDPRKKTPESRVMKYERKDEIKDDVAMRLVFFCTPTEAKVMGDELYELLRGYSNTRRLGLQDNISHPKDSGYMAMHITFRLAVHGREVPCEVQVMDWKSYQEAMCGDWSRFAYKSGEPGMMGILSRLLKPLLDPIRDESNAAKPYVDETQTHNGTSPGQRHIYTIHVNGVTHKIPTVNGISVVDAIYLATGSLVKASVYPAKPANDDEKGTIKLFEICPPEIYIKTEYEPLEPLICGQIRGHGNVKLAQTNDALLEVVRQPKKR
ncbi:MAG: hypothetical protein WC350_01130 [Candidatus Micrarchaeia archaeon]|jgi:hypothetical protein